MTFLDPAWWWALPPTIAWIAWLARPQPARKRSLRMGEAAGRALAAVALLAFLAGPTPSEGGPPVGSGASDPASQTGDDDSAYGHEPPGAPPPRSVRRIVLIVPPASDPDQRPEGPDRAPSLAAAAWLDAGLPRLFSGAPPDRVYVVDLAGEPTQIEPTGGSGTGTTALVAGHLRPLPTPPFNAGPPLDRLLDRLRDGMSAGDLAHVRLLTFATPGRPALAPLAGPAVRGSLGITVDWLDVALPRGGPLLLLDIPTPTSRTPEVGRPLTFRTSIRVVVPASARGSDGPEAGVSVRVRWHVEGVATPWRPVVLDGRHPTRVSLLLEPGAAGGAGDSQETGRGGGSIERVVHPVPAGVVSVRVEVAAAAAGMPESSDRGAGGRLVARATGAVRVWPRPRWFALAGAGMEAADHARLSASARQGGVEVALVEVVPRDPFAFAGGIVPTSALRRASIAELQRLGAWVAAGGALVVPTDGSPLRETDEPAGPRARALAAIVPAVVGPLRDALEDLRVPDVFDRDRPDARIAMMLMIDNSASMAQSVGQLTRSQYVRRAVRSAIASLEPDDRIAVGFFDTRPDIRGPLPATEANKATLLEWIRNRPGPAGGTGILRAVQRSRAILAAQDAAVRHLVLLSDGEETDRPLTADFNAERVALQRAGIGVSVVGVGRYDPGALNALFTPGHGTRHLQSGAELDMLRGGLPDIFLGEIRRAQVRGEQLLLRHDETGREPDLPAAIDRGTFAIVPRAAVAALVAARVAGTQAADPGTLGPVVFGPGFADLAVLPPARAVFELTARATARTLLLADADTLRGPVEARASPWLVRWRRGSGTVDQLASPLTTTGLPAWFSWTRLGEAIGSWWRQIGDPTPGRYRAAFDPAIGHHPGTLTLVDRHAVLGPDRAPFPGVPTAVLVLRHIVHDSDSDSDSGEGNGRSPGTFLLSGSDGRYPLPFGVAALGQGAWTLRRPGSDVIEPPLDLGPWPPHPLPPLLLSLKEGRGAAIGMSSIAEAGQGAEPFVIQLPAVQGGGDAARAGQEDGEQEDGEQDGEQEDGGERAADAGGEAGQVPSAWLELLLVAAAAGVMLSVFYRR